AIGRQSASWPHSAPHALRKSAVSFRAGGQDTGVDPWHDYLAFPVAPLTLTVQIGALFVRHRSLRWILGLACPAAIAAMFAYVTSLPDREGDGVNLGAAVLLLWLLASFVILAIAIVRELVTAARRGGRPAEQETRQST
ncbi:MAG: hypothetical protein ABWY12_03215, partial [Burkholderiales bacterium]